MSKRPDAREAEIPRWQMKIEWQSFGLLRGLFYTPRVGIDENTAERKLLVQVNPAFTDLKQPTIIICFRRISTLCEYVRI